MLEKVPAHSCFSRYSSNCKGRIYLCVNRQQQEVILKAFAPSDPNLEHEYGMLRRLHRHPTLFVQLHTAVTFGTKWLALEMEYIGDAAVPFVPLSHRATMLHAFATHCTQVVAHVSLTIMQALSVLHGELHLIHGDIKPDNVLYRRVERSVKLIDFESADTGPAAPARTFPSGMIGAEVR